MRLQTSKMATMEAFGAPYQQKQLSLVDQPKATGNDLEEVLEKVSRPSSETGPPSLRVRQPTERRYT